MSSLLALSSGGKCDSFEPSGGGRDDEISSPVGENARNLAKDVRTVQRLLNGLPPANSGPNPPLVVDGIAGPLTKRAIRQFQSRQLGFADGRVDPEGPTLQKLRDLSPGGGLSAQTGPAAPGTPSDRPQDRAARLAMAIRVRPEVRRAIVKARLALDAALLFLLGQTPLGGVQPQAKTLGVFKQHFGEAPKNKEADSIHFVLKNLINMLAAADNARPSIFGGTFGNFLDIDPIPILKDAKGRPLFAYVRRRGTKNTTLDKAGVDPTKIYLTPNMNGRPPDEFIRIGLHELAHLSSNQGPAMLLDDHASGFDANYSTLPHTTRLRNADSYANFAFEITFGNERLAAIMPLLRVIEIREVVIT